MKRTYQPVIEKEVENTALDLECAQEQVVTF